MYRWFDMSTLDAGLSGTECKGLPLPELCVTMTFQRPLLYNEIAFAPSQMLTVLPGATG
jgi:hypothetical protein